MLTHPGGLRAWLSAWNLSKVSHSASPVGFLVHFCSALEMLIIDRDSVPLGSSVSRVIPKDNCTLPSLTSRLQITGYVFSAENLETL